MFVMNPFLVTGAFAFLSIAVTALATYSYHVKKLKVESAPREDLAALREDVAAIGARLDRIDERLADAVLQSHDDAPRLADPADG
jgi:hypothetical protein